MHQARMPVRRSASRMNGELHPTIRRTVHETNFRTSVRVFLHMDDSFELIFLFSSVTESETAMGILCNCLVGALPYAH